MTSLRSAFIAAAILALPALAVSAFLSPERASATGDHTSCFAVGSAEPCRLHNFRPSPPKPGVTTYWIDTDGENPGVAGCHIEVRGANDPRRLPGGRVFGELCHPDERGRPNQILIESNPGANVIHPHTNDYGHPYRISCPRWCAATQPGSRGSCLEVTVIVRRQGEEELRCRSARCNCTR